MIYGLIALVLIVNTALCAISILGVRKESAKKDFYNMTFVTHIALLIMSIVVYAIVIYMTATHTHIDFKMLPPVRT